MSTNKSIKSPKDLSLGAVSNIPFSRITIVWVGLELCLGLLIGRLFLVQYVHGRELRERSENQRNTQVVSQAKRATILDRHGSVFAINQDWISVYADPKVLRDKPDELARKLALLLNVSEARLLSILQQRKRRFVWLKRNIEYERIDDIRRVTKSIYGVGYRTHGKRSYPKDELASHIIGYTNFENRGIDGIEHQYDTYLSTGNRSDRLELQSKKRRVSTDGKRRPIRPPQLYQQGGQYGRSVVLTVDEYIQHITERELIAGCEEWQAKAGSAIVMHSKSGEILALANYPNYNLNHYSRSEESAKRNRAIWMQYEPGSVFKIVTAAALLNEKLMFPDSREYCEMGEYRLSNGHVVHDIRPNAWLTLSEIIAKSSNIGILKAARRLNKEQLEIYTRRFGFSEKTGIDLPYERVGSLRGIRKWDDYTIASVPFGQGISVTPIQVLNALNVIATNGVLLQPYVTRQIIDRDEGLLEQSFPKPIRRVISAETAQAMTQMLVGVTEAGGGLRARVEGYTVAGKTGTAQKAERGQGYVEGKVVATFAGFLPAEDALLSIIVVVDEPADAPFSSRVTAPMFRKIASEAMRYLSQKNLSTQTSTPSYAESQSALH
ncbi:penicillin-binding protein 2 [Candidatus Poribacteria bacterium]|nr:penicillin-binding protein 2 [Candidatus Poribacteria bacterium]